MNLTVLECLVFLLLYSRYTHDSSVAAVSLLGSTDAAATVIQRNFRGSAARSGIHETMSSLQRSPPAQGGFAAAAGPSSAAPIALGTASSHTQDDNGQAHDRKANGDTEDDRTASGDVENGLLVAGGTSSAIHPDKDSPPDFADCLGGSEEEKTEERDNRDENDVGKEHEEEEDDPHISKWGILAAGAFLIGSRLIQNDDDVPDDVAAHWDGGGGGHQCGGGGFVSRAYQHRASVADGG